MSHADFEGFRLSVQQEHYWRLQTVQASGLAGTYGRIQLDGPCDLRRLEHSLQQLSLRHEALRTRLQSVPGLHLPLQVIAATPAGITRQRDATLLSPPVQAQAIEAYWQTFQSSALQGNALTVELLRCTPAKHYLFVALGGQSGDRCSLHLLLQEWQAMYAGEILLETELQYADYAEWQHEVLEAQRSSSQHYWAQHWLPDLTRGRLPLARWEQSSAFTPARQSWSLSPALSTALRQQAGSLGTGPEIWLLAAWVSLLARHLEQPELGLSLTHHGRPQPAAQAIGAYAKELPLRCQLRDGQTFAELLGDLARHLQDHDLWQESWGPEAPRRYPLGYAYLPEAVLGTRGHLSWTLQEAFSVTAPCSLQLHCHENGAGLQLVLHYNAQQFDPMAVTVLWEQWHTLLQGTLAQPHTALLRLPLLSPTERTQVLAFAGSPGPAPGAALLHTTFERQAAQTPMTLAAVYGKTAWTYATLNQQANQLARCLLERGLQPGDRVGLHLRQPLHTLQAMLAVLKAGGTYVPLDPALPVERQRFLSVDAHLRYGLTEVCGEAPFVTASLEWLDIPTLHAAMQSLAATDLHLPIHPAQLAYIFYTSGSTGQPKGVAVNHANAVYSTLARHTYYAAPVEAFLLLSPFVFDSSVAGIYWTLSQGGCLCLPEAEERHDVFALGQLIERHQITHLLSLPSLYAVLLEQLPAAQLCSLQVVIVAGESCPPDLPRRHQACLPQAQLYNEYGPTEATVWSTVQAVHPAAADPPVPIGRPIPGAQVYVLDDALDLVPRGVAGELYVGGPGISQGYIGRSALTAERFLADAYGSGRLYRSGDRVRWRLDGTLEFLGRTDQQVKLRGYRIELGEIEARLRTHPQVRDAAVILRQEQPGEARLVAYVVGHQRGLNVAALQAHLQAALPEFMQPAAWVELETLPLNANGKLDRASLPAPAAPQRQNAYVEPHNAVESALAQLWQELLGVERVGTADNFFALGGDSILSIQMVGRARQHGIAITARQVFEQQTIAALARVASSASQQTSPPDVSNAPVPLTPIQQWFFELGYAHPELWTHAILLKPRQPLDARAAQTAVDTVVRHHDALRAHFVYDGASWQQHILPEAPTTAWQQVDLPVLTDSEDSAAPLSSALLAIDPGTGPLLRVLWFPSTPAGSGHLLIVLHHLVADGLSWRIVLEDIQTAYRQALAGQAVVLPPQTTPWRQWAERLWTYARSPEVQAEHAFWSALSPHAGAALPVDMPGGSGREEHSTTLRVALSAAETATLLQEAAPTSHTRVDELLLTALALTLSRWQGSAEVLLDVDRHGREAIFPDMDLSRTVGWFTSVAPTLLRVDPTATSLANLKALRGQLREAPRQGLHYGLLRYLQPPPAAPLLVQARILFNYMGQLDPTWAEATPLELVHGEVYQGRHPDWQRPHELAINAEVLGGQLRVAWDYSAARYQASTIEHLAEDFLQTLRELMAACLESAAVGYTPADFPLAALQQTQLDVLFGQERGIDDIYPLSPVQAGMLFHSLYSPDSGVYVQQISGILEGDLDIAALHTAWQTLLARHSILRTACHWQGIETPLQVVYQHVDLPMVTEDWQHEAFPEPRWQAYLAADRQRGFDCMQAPLMRVALLRLAAHTYGFLWTHHHLILDGWCLPVVFTELFALYTALQQGRPLPPPRPASRYRDYIAWLQQQDTAAAECFWHQALTGMTGNGILALPRPVSVDGQGTERLVFSVAETARLESFARQHQVTLNTLLQGAWALLLSHYNHTSDVLFGVTVAGRPATLPGMESMLGLCINTLPLRVRLQPQARVRDWLRELMAHNLALRDYETTPLGSIQGWCGVPRGQTWFESVVVFENYPLEPALEAAARPLTVRDIHFDERTNYPLTLVGLPGASLQLHLTYERSRFAVSAMARMAGHLRTLLLQLIAHPEACLADLSCLSTIEQQQLAAWQQMTAGAGLTHPTLHVAFEQQAHQHPQAIALRHHEDSWSYGELNAHANRLARLLRQHGVGIETRVGLCLPRGFTLVIGILAILKAGGAYVPLDPAYPAARLQHIMTDAGIALIVTDTVSARALPEAAGSLLRLDVLQEQLATQAAEDLRLEVPSQAACYVIYTSGSSGQPKGVVVSHTNVLRLFQVTQAVLHFGPQDVWTLLHSYAFDFSVWELWGALLHGGRLVIVPHEMARAPQELHRLLQRQGVTVFNQTPSSFYQFDSVDAALGEALALRLLIFGGEALELARLQGWLRRHGDMQPRLVNMYGITETTVHVTCQPITHAEVVSAASLIGRPLADLHSVILDAWGNPVPVGVTGELYVGGAGVSRGYLGQSALTAERFLPNPWGQSPGERLYRTGDLGRYHADGRIEYLGRSDQQVKIRGFRIEPGEIEARLCEHPQVQEAWVLLRHEPPAEARLVAYVVLRQGNLESAVLRAHVQSLLPDYMVPATYVQLATMPLTAHGKRDAQALPPPEDSGSQQEAAATALEEAVAAVWQQVLGRTHVGVLDDFFAVGGHSLLATQVVSRLQAAFEVDIPLALVFECPTIRAQAAMVEQALLAQISGLNEESQETCI